MNEWMNEWMNHHRRRRRRYCYNAHLYCKVKTYKIIAEFIEAVNDNTGGISKHMFRHITLTV